MANLPVDRKEVMAKVNHAFTRRHLFYKYEQARRSRRLDRLNKEKDRISHKGVALPKSDQISLEAQWLINYTDDWARADKTLDRLESSLHEGNQPDEQQPDGSWATGYTEPYRKLEPTVVALQNLKDVKEADLLPLTFMQDLQDPKYVTDWLDRVRCSEIHQTGRNNRDEFGSLITSVTQLFFKNSLKRVFEDHPRLKFKASNESFISLRDYLWEVQSAVTGYWGPTYDFDGEVIEVQDLSYTFHVVKYYNDGGNGGAHRTDLRRTNELVATTGTIKDYLYPNGLRQEPLSPFSQPTFSDHNNYDLVTMFQQLWPGMPDDAKQEARKEISLLLDWCLTKSLQGDIFAPSKRVSTINSYYYGVVFLKVAGFWAVPPFWTTPPVVDKPDPRELAAKLRARFDREFYNGTNDAKTVEKLFEEIMHTPPAA
jgi:hypothetical protein